jgi:sulfur carrier protein
MRLLLNGDSRTGDTPRSPRSPIWSRRRAGLDPARWPSSANLEIVPRSTYADTALAEGDRIEIVTFVGGG